MSGYLSDDSAAEHAMAMNELAVANHRPLYDPNKARYTHCVEEDCGEELAPLRVQMGASRCVECKTRIEQAKSRMSR